MNRTEILMRLRDEVTFRDDFTAAVRFGSLPQLDSWSLVSTGAISWDSANERLQFDHTDQGSGVQTSFRTVPGLKYLLKFTLAYLGSPSPPQTDSVSVAGPAGILTCTADGDYDYSFAATSAVTTIQWTRDDATGSAETFFLDSVLVTYSQSFVLDTYETVPFPITYQLADIREIDSRHTAYTKTVVLPGTKNNNVAFKHAFGLDVDQAFDLRHKADAQVMVDGIPILNGFLQLRRVNTVNMRTESYEYEVVIYGKIADLITDLGDSTLLDLDFTELTHERSIITIENSWTNTPESGGYVYPLVDYCDTLVTTSATQDFDWDNISSVSITAPGNQFKAVQIDQMRPAVFVRTVLDKIFKTAGYEYVSNFISGPEFDKLILLMPDSPVPFTGNPGFEVAFSSGGFTPAFMTYGTTSPVPFDLDSPLPYFNSSPITFDISPGVYTSTAPANSTNAQFDFSWAVRAVPNVNTITTHIGLPIGAAPQYGPYGTAPVCSGLNEYHRYAYIYTATELNVGLPCMITDIAFGTVATSYGAGAGNNTANVKIYMKETSASAFVASTVAAEEAGSLLVYTGTITTSDFASFTGTWINRHLTTAFSYSGASNLEVIVHYETLYPAGRPSYGFFESYNPGSGNMMQSWSSCTVPPLGNGTPNNVGRATTQIVVAYGDGNFSTRIMKIPLGTGTPIVLTQAFAQPATLSSTTHGTISTGNIAVTPTDVFYAEIEYLTGNNMTFYNSNGGYQTYFKGKYRTVFKGNSQFRQSDLILGLVKMFNLYMEPNAENPRQILIEPRDRYYDDVWPLYFGTVPGPPSIGGDDRVILNRDWTRKLDVSQTSFTDLMSEIQNRTFDYSYQSDSDQLNVDYTIGSGLIYGEDKFVIDNDFVNGTTSITTTFHPTPGTAMRQTSSGTGLNQSIVVPKIGTRDAAGVWGTTDYGVRIMYFKYFPIPSPPYVWYLTDGGNYPTGTHDESYLPYAGMYDDPYSPTRSLEFEKSRSQFFVHSATDNTLFNLYYKNQMAEINNVNARLLTAYFDLQPVDLTQLRFNDRIFVDGTFYHLNRIVDYDPSSNATTKVELIRTDPTGDVRLGWSGREECDSCYTVGGNMDHMDVADLIDGHYYIKDDGTVNLWHGDSPQVAIPVTCADGIVELVSDCSCAECIQEADEADNIITNGTLDTDASGFTLDPPVSGSPTPSYVEWDPSGTIHIYSLMGEPGIGFSPDLLLTRCHFYRIVWDAASSIMFGHVDLLLDGVNQSPLLTSSSYPGNNSVDLFMPTTGLLKFQSRPSVDNDLYIDNIAIYDLGCGGDDTPHPPCDTSVDGCYRWNGSVWVKIS